jgi:hypothetical protein
MAYAENVEKYSVFTKISICDIKIPFYAGKYGIDMHNLGKHKINAAIA